MVSIEIVTRSLAFCGFAAFGASAGSRAGKLLVRGTEYCVKKLRLSVFTKILDYGKEVVASEENTKLLITACASAALAIICLHLPSRKKQQQEEEST